MADISKIKTPSGNTYDFKDAKARQQILTFSGKTLDLTKAVSDSTYSGYPYKVTLALPGVTAAYVPEVYLKTATDVISDICESVYAGVTFYATKNSGTVTIDTIVCVRGGNL